MAGLLNDFVQYYNLAPVPETGIKICGEPRKIYKEIQRCAKKPTAICDYCSEKIEMIPWAVKHNACLDDWLYHSGEMPDKENNE